MLPNWMWMLDYGLMLSRLPVVKSSSRRNAGHTKPSLSNQYSIFCGKTGITVHLRCFIVFLDPKNIGLDTKIVIVGPFNMKWGPKTYFAAAILNFQFLAGTVGLTSWFPQFFEINTPKNPLGQSFMLSSQSAQVSYKL